jgi:hypothetical protein
MGGHVWGSQRQSLVTEVALKIRPSLVKWPARVPMMRIITSTKICKCRIWRYVMFGAIVVSRLYMLGQGVILVI